VAETASAEDLYTSPRHPYTNALLSAIPVPDPTYRKKRVILQGDVPSPIHPPSGCFFHPRCPSAREKCSIEAPQLSEAGTRGHSASCHYPLPENPS